MNEVKIEAASRDVVIEIEWRRINGEPFEYAIQQGPFGAAFVKFMDGTCLRRRIADEKDVKNELDETRL